MAIFARLRSILGRLGKKSATKDGTVIKMITDSGSGFYCYDGVLYKSDVVRSAIRPMAKAVGKAVAKHICESVSGDGKTSLKVNPEAYIKFLLTEPNPMMSGQMLQERMATQLMLNNNAFALVVRDMYGYPSAIYPIPAVSVQKKYDKAGTLYLEFWYRGGGSSVFAYTDIIHIANDVGIYDVMGIPPADSLLPLMEVVSTVDQGIVKAVKNSAVIKWLLTYTQSLRPEDIKKNAKQFVDNFLSLESESIGVAATDSKAEVKQIEPKEYIPNAALLTSAIKRIYNMYNISEHIISSDWTEDQWTAYYEGCVEPVLLQLADQYSMRIFTRKERAQGNRIVFEGYNLAAASLQTRLSLVQMVDRAALTVNEWRAALNLAPVEGGDKLLLRKDTGIVMADNKDGDDNGD